MKWQCYGYTSSPAHSFCSSFPLINTTTPAGIWGTSLGNWSIVTLKSLFLSPGLALLGVPAHCTAVWKLMLTQEMRCRRRGTNGWRKGGSASLLQGSWNCSGKFISSVPLAAASPGSRNGCNCVRGWQKAARWSRSFLLLCSQTDGADSDFLMLLLSLSLEDRVIYCSVCGVTIHRAEIAFPCISSALWFSMAVSLCLLRGCWFHSMRRLKQTAHLLSSGFRFGLLTFRLSKLG